MVRQRFLRTALVSVSALLMLFFFSFIFVLIMYEEFDSISALSWAYYIVELAVVVASFSSICIYQKAFASSGNRLCIILAFLSLIAYSCVDIFVQRIHILFIEDVLDHAVKLRYFFSIFTIGCMFIDQYANIFYQKRGYRYSIVFAALFSMIIAAIVPTSLSYSVHILFLLAVLIVLSLLRSIDFNYYVVNLRPMVKFLNVFCDLNLFVGTFLYVANINKYISVLGGLQTFLTFIILALRMSKSNNL